MRVSSDDPLDSTLRDRIGDLPALAPSRLLPLVIGGAPVVQASFHVPIGRSELGRAHTQPIDFEADPRVSRTHAILTSSPGGELTLENASASGTEVNGTKIRHTVLRDGDLVMIGASALLVRTQAEGADAAMAGLVGRAPTMCAIRRAASKIARSELMVLLLGESGTGKEVTARALHEASGRSGPFVAINCAAIPANLAESQLFGHVAGAFTGAQRASAGVFRAAHGGTLFLDEIAELPLDLQPKLLRVLEDREVSAVGSVTSVPVDARVIAATNRDVVEEVRTGRFRNDLYARLAEFSLFLPPLRERREDILTLLAHHYGEPLPAMRFDLVRALLLHPWPFNVRELRTIAAHLHIVVEGSGGEPIDLSAIGDRLEVAARLATPADLEVESPGPRAAAPTREALEAMLVQHHGNIAEIARVTGRSRKQVYRWIAAFELDAQRFRAM